MNKDTLNKYEQNIIKYSVIRYLDFNKFITNVSKLTSFVLNLPTLKKHSKDLIITNTLLFLKTLPYIEINSNQISQKNSILLQKVKNEWDIEINLNYYYYLFHPTLDSNQCKTIVQFFDFVTLEWDFQRRIWAVEYDAEHPRYESGKEVKLDDDELLEEMMDQETEKSNESNDLSQIDLLKKYVFYLYKIILFGKDYYLFNKNKGRKNDFGKNYIDFIMEHGDENNFSKSDVVEFMEKQNEKILLEAENAAKRKNIKKYYKLIDSKYDNPSIDEDDESQL